MLRALLARVSPLGDQPIELAYTNLFVFEQAPQRIKLNRITSLWSESEASRSPLQARHSVLTENRNWQEAATFARITGTGGSNPFRSANESAVSNTFSRTAAWPVGALACYGSGAYDLGDDDLTLRDGVVTDAGPLRHLGASVVPA